MKDIFREMNESIQPSDELIAELMDKINNDVPDSPKVSKLRWIGLVALVAVLIIGSGGIRLFNKSAEVMFIVYASEIPVNSGYEKEVIIERSASQYKYGDFLDFSGYEIYDIWFEFEGEQIKEIIYESKKLNFSETRMMPYDDAVYELENNPAVFSAGVNPRLPRSYEDSAKVRYNRGRYLQVDYADQMDRVYGIIVDLALVDEEVVWENNEYTISATIVFENGNRTKYKITISNYDDTINISLN